MKLDDKERARFETLWRYHLRFPGAVSKRVVRALRGRNGDALSSADVEAVYQECLKLGVRAQPFSSSGAS